MVILIRNGWIVDGTGKPGFAGDVLVEDDRIAAVGACPTPTAAEVIDVGGLAVAPGFIDTHTHSDLAALTQPRLSSKIRQGITTELLGQDGISMAPLPGQYIAPWRKNLAGLDGVSDDIDWTYATTDRYLDMLEAAKPATNLAYLAPHGNVRMEAMGLGNRKAGASELKDMVRVLERELAAGAFGLSTGLIYMPCAYASTDELVELCRAVAASDGIFVVHQRSEADDILTSTQELLDVARRSGVWLHISHMKVCGRKNWDKLEPMLALLEAAQAEGVRISFDQYPYVAGSTMLGVILPPWVHDGGTDKVIERLGSPQLRAKMIEDIERGIPGWDNFIDFAGLDQIFVTSVVTQANQDAVGKNLIELGRMRGKDPYNATFDLLQQEENAVGMVDFYGTEEHVVRLMTHPMQNVCTDGLMGAGKPHPRVYGAFPRVLGKYVRDEKVMSLPEAIGKMTGKPAEVLGLKDRGLLRPGFAADLVIFDPVSVADKGTYVEPAQFPDGIRHVMVNGGWAVRHGEETGSRYGQVLRKGRT
jgi:N-acyl-D-amino-acid deacylase